MVRCKYPRCAPARMRVRGRCRHQRRRRTQTRGCVHPGAATPRVSWESLHAPQRKGTNQLGNFWKPLSPPAGWMLIATVKPQRSPARRGRGRGSFLLPPPRTEYSRPREFGIIPRHEEKEKKKEKNQSSHVLPSPDAVIQGLYASGALMHSRLLSN